MDWGERKKGEEEQEKEKDRNDALLVAEEEKM